MASFSLRIISSLVIFFGFLFSAGSLSPTSITLTREPPSQVTLASGQSAQLECQASYGGDSGRPVAGAAVRWRKDGLPLSELPLANGSLLLRGRSNDAGRYQCTVTVDGHGTFLSRVARVTFLGKTEFEISPTGVVVFLGQTAFFQCKTNRKSQVTWYKNGGSLNLDSSRMTILPSGSLEITDVNIGDRGSYVCGARLLGDSSSTEMKSVPAELKLNMDLAASHAPTPPTFVIIPPSTLKVLEGDEVTLECAANGVPTPAITWLKDGVALDLADFSGRIRRSGNGSLTVRNVRWDTDRGGYQCRAENSEDSADVGLELRVLVPPRFKRQPVDRLSAAEKEDVMLECEVSGHPPPEVQWYKNGDLIIQSEYFQMVRGTDLKILGLVASDAGIYQCIGTNQAGSVQAPVRLSVTAEVESGSVPTNLAPSPRDPPLSLLLGGTGPGSPPVNLLNNLPAAPTNLQAVIISTRFVTLSWDPPETLSVVSSNLSPVTGYSVYYQQEGSVRERVVNSSRGSLEEISLQGLLPATHYTVRVLAHNEHGAGPSTDPLVITTQAEVELPGPPLALTANAVSAFSILINWMPPIGNNDITKYKLYYRRGEYSAEEEITLPSSTLQYHLSDLREFTEYTFWISAFNKNGEGAYSEEVASTTYSDVPADPPQNATVEPASASSIIVRWEPPPRESQNGIITGYKIKWRAAKKERGSNKPQTVSTDGSRRLYAVTGLDNGREYQVKISALTVNGSGPATGWMAATTFESDLDESVVPDPPSSLRAKATDNEITIMWAPPSSTNILVRGYTIGWGKGIPDEYTKVVDNKQRYFIIENLKPNSEYVISLRAYNNIGDGRPIYETTRTHTEEPKEASTPLVPPLGLHAIVLSSTTVVLTWVDSTLPRNQLITDTRYYIVRYTSTISLNADRPKHNYRNATDLNSMLDDLRPNTEYEFTVKVVKGRRQSPWSLVVLNTTQEAAPDSAPRELTVLPFRPGDSEEDETENGLRRNNDDGVSVTLTWLPPRRPNGRINGYVIFYTEDKRRPDRDWVVEGVVGDKTAVQLHHLAPDTRYYFKIQARNSKGYGPHSSAVVYRTTVGGSHDGGLTSLHKADTADGGSELAGSNSVVAGAAIPPLVQYAVFATASVIVLLAVIFALVMCRRGAASRGRGSDDDDDGRRNKKKSYMKSSESGSSLREKLNNPPPPDLWINHDQLELKSIDSASHQGGHHGAAADLVESMAGGAVRPPSLPCSSTPTVDMRGSTSTLDRSRYIQPYSGTESERSFTHGRESHHRLLPACGSKHAVAVKPIKIAAINGKPKIGRYLSRESVGSTLAGGSCGGSSSTYIRSQYNINPPPASGGGGTTCHSPEPLLPPGSTNGCCSSSGMGGSESGCCCNNGPPSSIGTAGGNLCGPDYINTWAGHNSSADYTTAWGGANTTNCDSSIDGSSVACGGSLPPPSNCGGSISGVGLLQTAPGGGAHGSAMSGHGGCQFSHAALAQQTALSQEQNQYLSSAMSTSSADSGSVSQSGRGSGSSSGIGSIGGGGGPNSSSRRPSQHQLRSFSSALPNNAGLSHPKAVFVRPTPTSPFKRPLTTASHHQLQPELTGHRAAISTENHLMHSGLGTASPESQLSSPNVRLGCPGGLTPMGEVRSPDVLHPKAGPCDCLSQSLQPSVSTEELNNEMMNLESVMEDLNDIAGHRNGHSGTVNGLG